MVWIMIKVDVINMAHEHRHAWMSYMVDVPPPQDPILQRRVREWEPKEHKTVPTFTRAAYKPFST